MPGISRDSARPCGIAVERAIANLAYPKNLEYSVLSDIKIHTTKHS